MLALAQRVKDKTSGFRALSDCWEEQGANTVIHSNNFPYKGLNVMIYA